MNYKRYGCDPGWNFCFVRTVEEDDFDQERVA